MDIALDGNHHLRLVEADLFHLHELGHCQIEFFIDLRFGMHVMQRAVIVQDLDLLSGHHAHHTGSIETTLLVEYGRFRGHVESFPFKPFAHVHEYVLHCVAFTHQQRLTLHSFGVFGSADRIGRHLERSTLLRSIRERHSACDPSTGHNIRNQRQPQPQGP